jgi:hypothetical protein
MSSISDYMILEEAVITPKGIFFQNYYYTCSSALKERWFHEGNINGNQKIKIFYTPDNLEFIYVLTHEDSILIAAFKVNLDEFQSQEKDKLHKYYQVLCILKEQRNKKRRGITRRNTFIEIYKGMLAS